MSVLQKNKKVAAGIGVAAAAAAVLALGAGTYAAFSDTETGPTSTFAAGTLDLVVGEPKGVNVFEATGIAPGYQSGPQTLTFRNNGSLPGTLSLRFTATSQENGCGEPEVEVDPTCGATEGELGAALIIAIEGPGLSYTGPIAGVPAIRGAVVPASTREGISYKATFSLPNSVGNEVQSDGAVVTSVAVLTQQ